MGPTTGPVAAPTNPIAYILGQLAAWNAAHTMAQQIDPRAELAVAQQEGLGGGIGDAGTSFGPNQLHIGGAYPGFAPQAPSAANAWAWSPAGLQYDFGQIAGVAGGLRGAPAVQNIVSRFERPADPTGEIARALAAYGGTPTGGQAPTAPSLLAAATAPRAQRSVSTGPARASLSNTALNRMVAVLLGGTASAPRAAIA